MSIQTVAAVPCMLNANRSEKEIEFVFSSEVLLVDQVVPLACDYLRERGLTEFDHFKLVLRELLLNAIEHGNHNDPQKMVRCKIARMRGSMVEISVEDQGEGFCHQDLNLSMPEDPEQARNRGLALVNAMTEGLLFNDKGNCVTAFVCTESDSAFEVREEDGWQIIHANADLTASVANKFRMMLLGLVNAGHTRFRFDLEEVEDIDSVALSVLFVLSKMLADRGEKALLEIVHATESLQTLFRMTRLDQRYTIVTK